MPRTADPNRTPHPKDLGGFSISARFPKDVFAQIHEIAQNDQRSLNFVVNQLVKAGLAAMAEPAITEGE
jgi:hypothetical protein